jgi:chaperonin GroES
MTKRLYVPDHFLNKEKERRAASAVSQKPNLLDPARFLEEVEKDEADSALDRLPKPTGWRILILPYTPAKETKGGVLLADETVERNRLSTNVGYVVSLGPDAYKDEYKFPEGPWCKEGDWVLFGRYAGSRFKIDGAEPRLLNDDEILAVIKDPRDIVVV